MNLNWLRLLLRGDPFEQTGKSGLRYLKEWLEAGLSPETTNSRKKTLLYYYFDYNEMDYVCLLLQKGADPNRAVIVGFQKEQATIMEKALFRDHSYEFLELLLTYGAEYEYLRKEEWAEEDIKRLDEMAPRCYQLHDARQQGFQALEEKNYEAAREAFRQAVQLLQIFLDEMNAKINASNPECDKEYRNKQIYANDYQIRLEECQQKIKRCNEAISTQRMAECPDEAISAQQKLELDSSARRRSASGTSSEKTEISESSPVLWLSGLWTFFSPAPHRLEEGKNAMPSEETQPLLVSSRDPSNPPNAELRHRISPSK